MQHKNKIIKILAFSGFDLYESRELSKVEFIPNIIGAVVVDEAEKRFLCIMPDVCKDPYVRLALNFFADMALFYAYDYVVSKPDAIKRYALKAALGEGSIALVSEIENRKILG